MMNDLMETNDMNFEGPVADFYPGDAETQEGMSITAEAVQLEELNEEDRKDIFG